MLVAQTFQHFRIRRPACFGFLSGRQFQILKQHNAELLRRKNVEFLSGMLIDELFFLADFALEHVTECPDAVCIHAHTDMLHIGKHLNQRQLNLTEKLLHALLLHLLFQIFRERRQRRNLPDRGVHSPRRAARSDIPSSRD